MAQPDATHGLELNDSQQEALATYLSLTNQDTEAAIPILQRSQWNVQIAVSKFFDGDSPDALAEAIASEAAAPAPQRMGQRGVLMDEMEYIRPTRSPRDAAPRIVPQPSAQGSWRPPLPLALVLFPLNLVWKLLSRSFSLVGWLFPILPRLVNSVVSRSASRNGLSSKAPTGGRRPLNPRDTAARFIREFGEEFGEQHGLHFYENGYAQAYDLAKRELRFLVVILLSPEHDSTSTFIRETLLSPEVTSFLNNPEKGIILWAGNVQDSEAYQVACGLSCTKFPFTAMIVHTPQDTATAMSTVARITGLPTPTEFVSKLQNAISQHASPLERTRAQRAEQEATRNLRQQQETAYERSLAQDRERTRLRKEAEAAKQREEQETRLKAEETQRKAEQVLLWKRWRAATLAPEPEASVKDAIRISLRMPSGERLVRRFHPEASIDDIYAFVECHETGTDDAAPSQPPKDYEHEYKFQLVSPMPRVVYDIKDGGSVAQKIGRSGNLIVESSNPADEDD